MQRKHQESQGKPWLFCFSWEQRKFSDFVQRESAFRVSSSEYPSVEYEDVVAEEGRLNKDVRKKETQKTGIIFDGTQVLYGKLRPYLHNWLNPDFSGIAVGDWWVLRPVGVDKKFLYRLIQTQQFDEVANQSSGSKMPRADWNLVSNTEFTIPSSLDEQRQVAETFEDLDNLITLHQRFEFSLSSAFRKNALSWEQRKLGEVGKARSGVGFPDTEQGGSSGIPFFKVSDMNNDGNENEMIVANNYVTDAQIAARRWSPIEEVPAIFFAKVGAAVMLNRKRLCRFPFLLDNNTMAYSLGKDQWDADFAKALFETVDLTTLVQVGALPSYNAGDVEAMGIMLPEIPEQRQIGAYFRQLDNLITLHQREHKSEKQGGTLNVKHS
ncbi:MAG: restriction endonuclease subunit S [Christensenellales bacterium]